MRFLNTKYEKLMKYDFFCIELGNCKLLASSPLLSWLDTGKTPNYWIFCRFFVKSFPFIRISLPNG